MIEAFPAPATAALANQWFGLAKNMMDIKFAPVVGATIITKAAWDRIDPSLRPTLLTAGAGDGHQVHAADPQARDRRHRRDGQARTADPDADAAGRAGMAADGREVLPEDPRHDRPGRSLRRGPAPRRGVPRAEEAADAGREEAGRGEEEPPPVKRPDDRCTVRSAAAAGSGARRSSSRVFHGFENSVGIARRPRDGGPADRRDRRPPLPGPGRARLDHVGAAPDAVGRVRRRRSSRPATGATSRWPRRRSCRRRSGRYADLVASAVGCSVAAILAWAAYARRRRRAAVDGRCSRAACRSGWWKRSCRSASPSSPSACGGSRGCCRRTGVRDRGRPTPYPPAVAWTQARHRPRGRAGRVQPRVGARGVGGGVALAARGGGHRRHGPRRPDLRPAGRPRGGPVLRGRA